MRLLNVKLLTQTGVNLEIIKKLKILICDILCMSLVKKPYLQASSLTHSFYNVPPYTTHKIK